jgi:hypothetical protein
MKRSEFQARTRFGLTFILAAALLTIGAIRFRAGGHRIDHRQDYRSIRCSRDGRDDHRQRHGPRHDLGRPRRMPKVFTPWPNCPSGGMRYRWRRPDSRPRPSAVRSRSEPDGENRRRAHHRAGFVHCRGVRRRSAAADRDHRGGHGDGVGSDHQPAARNAQLQPADAADAGRGHHQPGRFQFRAVDLQLRPAVHQRQSRAGELLPAGRHGERGVRRQQRRLRAQRGCHAGIQRHHQQSVGRVRTVHGRRDQRDHQVGDQLLPRRSVRVPAQRRFERQ